MTQKDDPSADVCTDTPDAAWLRQNLNLVEVELLMVLQKHAALGDLSLCHALMELTGSICAAVITNPATRPAVKADIVGKLDQLRFFVIPTNEQTQ